MKAIHTPGAGVTDSPLSPAIRAGDMLFISGQVPRRLNGEWETGEFGDQVRCVLSNLRALIAAAGATPAQVCKLNAYLTDPGNFAEFNAICRKEFCVPFPARTTVCTQLMRAGIMVEIEAIVWLGDSSDRQ